MFSVEVSSCSPSVWRVLVEHFLRHWQVCQNGFEAELIPEPTFCLHYSPGYSWTSALSENHEFNTSRLFICLALPSSQSAAMSSGPSQNKLTTFVALLICPAPKSKTPKHQPGFDTCICVLFAVVLISSEPTPDWPQDLVRLRTGFWIGSDLWPPQFVLVWPSLFPQGSQTNSRRSDEVDCWPLPLVSWSTDRT